MSELNLVLLGFPGSGKGTQAKYLAQHYGVRHISTGDIFREEMAQKSDLGRQVSEYVRSGRLVPDSSVLGVVSRHLDAGSDGFVLDGFPRTLEQAQALDTYLRKKTKALSMVLCLNLTEEEVLRRLCNRRYCPQCDMVYNLLTRAPKAESRCDQCGGQLLTREDDQPDTVKKRLMVYRDLTEPLIAYYKANETFSSVDAARSIEEVAQALVRAIDSKGASVTSGGA